MDSSFNPKKQEEDLSSKIVAGMQRIAEVFKILLWDKAKMVGLSPIQIQILIFIAFHQRELCNVSYLAREFNVTKPTVSDAVKSLAKKGLISRDYSSSDNRSYTIILTPSGEELVNETHTFAHPLKMQLDKLNPSDREYLFTTISELIYKLNSNGILSVQRTCFGCKFYQKHNTTDYCNLLQKELQRTEIRLDCPEYESR